ncbi:acyl-CoA dehydrogenase family protein [Cryptosporangium phraense]|uniref:Acyl-CoA dehydrogenase n=1 Tax=Cryptosporangium phraense TaxID=2593070 RepID=A0A545APS4_9ACTN|nr:acyl-CoA dehydrogenase family protein [Cryptosporangium phraense]TQS43327.1 acyl-CoA dehydrogenase [Cryptosporangium phraense]
MGELAEFHDELRAVARELLGKPVEWPALAAAGWCGLEVPSRLDGAEATFAEVAVVLAELGRAAAGTSYFGTAVLGVGALLELEPSAERDELLRGVAQGTRLAVGDGFRLEGSRVSGRAEFVADATEADHLLLVVGDQVVVPAPGARVEPQPTLDATRRFGVVDVDGVPAVWVGRFAADGAVQRLRDRAATALACDSLGLAEAMLDATVAYVGTREQFGVPVGSFQAVKHACADMLVRVVISRTLVAAATRDDAGWVAAARAKSYVTAAAVDVVGKAMQLHGGIGYTWESGLHTYLKRATLNRALFGSPAAHRRRLAQRYR